MTDNALALIMYITTYVDKYCSIKYLLYMCILYTDVEVEIVLSDEETTDYKGKLKLQLVNRRRKTTCVNGLLHSSVFDLSCT